VRVAQGSHFGSDVIFAGVFMAMTAGLTHRASNPSGGSEPLILANCR
jgi:hypothetical protein